ncbi:hypothetical protein THZG08_570018 [Vibrio owensii]|nr:hypothetical protein THZG08_570018 [Vibrio owensii]CAH1586249.1 hypothetical protein THOA03_570018 [Vibrio owensii]
MLFFEKVFKNVEGRYVDLRNLHKRNLAAKSEIEEPDYMIDAAMSNNFSPVSMMNREFPPPA